MKLQIQLLAAGLIAAAGLLPFISYAETPEEKGLAIAVESDKRDNGFIDSTANMRMVLRNRAGKESIRNVRVKTLEVQGDGDKSLSIFDEPADVKGTASLTWSHADKPDDQWLYLPALKRVKRISSKNKSGPFMGSEFAFEDIGSQEVDKYTYKYLRDETLGAIETFVVERYPTDKYSGYTRQIAWIDKERYIAIKVEFYDRKNTLLKTLNSSDFNQYLNKYWRPGTMEMTNHQSGKSTTLTFENYQFQSGLTSSNFAKNALKKIR
ncbi:outer membrane lipoprotein-sorting protein [Chromatiales bacterium (ex Bugula neritina AB1)]|nr:outer membrane lipoprotein-sorting protein [Chromatiales bacterium (ex Bugula neritina AB1)]